MTAVTAFWTSLVRTLTPMLVGWIVTMFTGIGLAVDEEFRGSIEGLVTVGFGVVWYVAVRLLETYVTPKFGWLLGLAKAPEYAPNTTKPEA